jgi:hypothetical protein
MVTPVSSTPTAGWYPDPYNAAQIRYWDGVVWTDSVAAAAGTAPADARQLTDDATKVLPGFAPPEPPDGSKNPSRPTDNAAASGPAAQWAAPTGPPSPDENPAQGYTVAAYGSDSGPPGVWAPGSTAPGSGFGDIGDWLSSIFQRLVEQIGPIVVLMFLIPAVTAAIAAVLLQRLVSGLVIDLEPPGGAEAEVAGFNGGLLVLIVLVAVIGLLLAVIARLGANHQLYAAHGGQPQSLGSSLRTALRRLPRAVLWGLLLAIVLSALVVVLIVMLTVVVALAVSGDGGSPLFALLLPPIVVIAFIAGVWLWTKLAFFLPALAVGPAGTNPFAASSALSRGRFWAVFGRLLLVSVALSILWGIFNAVFQPIFGAASSDIFQVDMVTGDVFVGGDNVDTLAEIRWADVIPGAGWFAAVAIGYTLGRAIIDAIWTSAVTGLYWRGGGRGEV